MKALMFQSIPKSPTSEQCCVGTKASTPEPLRHIIDPNHSNTVSLPNLLNKGSHETWAYLREAKIDKTS